MATNPNWTGNDICLQTQEKQIGRNEDAIDLDEVLQRSKKVARKDKAYEEKSWTQPCSINAVLGSAKTKMDTVHKPLRQSVN